ncbi:zinc finger protein 511 isoform X1 [Acyrthosiphon pisum]|uniref:C2H2-type domain-containing protein n=2 Tax=Acyrthosiphon pisum TaxID=7029 RepID=A0A8R2D3M6_ACYPI|nr:zinc finger protein 511 isoform X1 [Acyrthosiphon pisum]|eukprot:XP_016659797.1 PREDICTED: zinc finger protein 511 [Acyrthosiphon pisum]
MTSMEKLQLLLARGTGHKNLVDDLFKTVDDSLKVYRRVGVFEITDQSNEQRGTDNFQCNVDGCTSSFTSMADYDSHYNSNHRYTCIYCRKLLQSAHLLDLHLSETHDNFFKVSSVKKPMFKCFIETCQTQFWNSEDRNVHCKEIHNMSKGFLQHYGNKKNQKKNKKIKYTAPPNLESMVESSMVIN